ncbi:serine/threonine-protein kinase [Brachybacterium saurashtrense]|uniref:non-specific serine/threonine protein kinase n=1 Tax=Brachybacterium saurashtrense TaxID=556288 RepID=A0A345YSK8_9MICO|nr:serine/threonine-protein kinase [Brachybacterium saurashtrense]AXK46910.1 serine/threonine protein kinase [Brachybacterium saurashtrense]RRR22625.1 serine/threonine protein kinase [Brachybacterium saurashtrense]
MTDVIVGRFALIDLIAKGGSGSVWRAWDSKTERLCAAKVLRQRDSADLMRFVREKGVSFDHPHLLTPYGWGAEDEHVVIAMPLVSGGTLESVVRAHGRIAEPAVVVLLDQLLDGLAHVHAEGWIHRDVKPANIMFEPRGTAWPASRLADFGIAVHETDVRFTHVGMVNGTPGYMAPELFSMAEPAPSHDLYAAGVVAMVALNGPLTLRDGSFRPEELNQHLRGVTPKLSAVIRRLVAAQPEDRYQDAAAVRRDLPRVPAGYPLTHADGTPLSFQDTLPALPPGAPGASRPERPAEHSGPTMEAIRAGRVQQAFSPPTASATSASPLTGPRPPHAGTSHPPQGAPFSPHPPTTTTGAAPAQDSARRGTLIAIALGAGTALVLGALAAVVLLLVFDGATASGPLDGTAAGRDTPATAAAWTATPADDGGDVSSDADTARR